ncbi:MAG TPA: hypothetical protein VKU87_00015 [Thermomicrobiaceae bacterium]|nr:hypothetical protein [Thermomicrobiaceae bacterium]
MSVTAGEGLLFDSLRVDSSKQAHTVKARSRPSSKTLLDRRL